LQSNNKKPASGNNSSKPYSELRYAINLSTLSPTGGPGPGATDAYDVYFNFKIPLRLFLGTWLAMNNDIYFGDTLTVILTWEDPSKWLWTSTSDTNPSLNAAAIDVNTSAANCTISNVYLQLAVEQDQEIRNEMIDAFKRGYEFDIPWFTKLNQGSSPVNSTAISISSPPITSAHGHTLKRVMLGVFNGVESNNTSLDNDNNPTYTENAARISTYQTT